MKIFPVVNIPGIDKYTVDQEPILSINLMERAAQMLTDWITKNISRRPIYIFAGPGNNGGDALALARKLALEGWHVSSFMLQKESLSQNCQINEGRLSQMYNVQHNLLDHHKFPHIPEEAIIIDGLFGAGLSRPLSGVAAKIVNYINSCPNSVISIDLPSGLMGEDNSTNDKNNIIKATYTLSFQFPKLSFLFSENEDYVGEWHILDIRLHPLAIQNTPTPWHYVTAENAKTILPVRDKFAHKGRFGHALLLSGSYGKMGAAVLASKACLKVGVGLLTTHVPHYGYTIMQTAVPEAMVSIDRSDILISEFPDLQAYDAIGIGPGIGTKVNTATAFSELLDKVGSLPLVIDADGLNLLSQNPSMLSRLPSNSVLTPHPKEFERLAGKWANDYDRLNKLTNFAHSYKVIVVLKGAYTTIACPDGSCYFNSTGNPGMASAGSGDVLTGIILGLLSQGIEPSKASILGVYLHGLAGDIFAAEESEEALTALEIINNMGKAFKKLRGNNPVG
jgi:NAD(P)H-hydrate epimerase